MRVNSTNVPCSRKIVLMLSVDGVSVSTPLLAANNRTAALTVVILIACWATVDQRLALVFLAGEVFLTVRQFDLDTLPCAKSRSRPGT